MRMLKHFESIVPNQKEVQQLINFLSVVYPVKTTTVLGKEAKFVILDDKPYYITAGKFQSMVNKSRFVDALSFELKDHFPLFSESSIRKAVKDFFEFHSKLN